MIPNLQMDYFKYSRLLRGNFLKGATLFRSLLNDAAVAESIINTAPAMAAVFTDFYKTAANRLLYDVLAESPYFDEAVMSYFRGVGATDHQTVEELLADTNNTLDLLHQTDFSEIIQKNPALLEQTLFTNNIFKALVNDENTDIVLRPDILQTFSDKLNPTSVNIYPGYNDFRTALMGTYTDFDGTLRYWDLTISTAACAISEEARLIFFPARLRAGTMSGQATGDVYFPGVLKYDIAADAWSLIHVASTDIRTTNITNYSRNANGMAYDPESDNLYVFYRPMYNTTPTLCDIFKGANGAAVQLGIQVSTAGTTSYMAPVFCCFDKESHLAKYVWTVGDMNAGSASATGWLYGCSVSANGLVWAGKAAHPTADQTATVYSVSATSFGANFRYPKGAYVGAFQTGSTIGTSYAYMVSIASTADRIKANYLQFDMGTSYSQLAAPTSIFMCENGFALMAWDSLQSYPTLAAFLFSENALTMHTMKKQSSSSYKYTLYGFPALNKAAAQTSQTGALFLAFGLTPTGLLEQSYDTAFSVFDSTLIPARGSDRYKLNTSVSNQWMLYDYLLN